MTDGDGKKASGAEEAAKAPAPLVVSLEYLLRMKQRPKNKSHRRAPKNKAG